MNKFLLLILLTLGCSHHKETGDKLLVKGQCEDKFSQVRLTDNQVIWRNVSGAGLNGASYLITGLAYSTDYTIKFTEGVVTNILTCTPYLVAAGVTLAMPRDANTGSLQGSSQPSLHCSDLLMDGYLDPKLRNKSDYLTRKWNCPDLDKIAEGLLAVSSCYQEKGEPELARQQLENIKSSEPFQKCLSYDLKKKLGMVL